MLVKTSLPFNHFPLSHLHLYARRDLFISLVEDDRRLDPETGEARCLANLFNPDVYTQTGRFIALSQAETGHVFGLSRQRVSQALQILDQAGLLRIAFGADAVVDLSGLRSDVNTSEFGLALRGSGY